MNIRAKDFLSLNIDFAIISVFSFFWELSDETLKRQYCNIIVHFVKKSLGSSINL